MKPNVCMLSSLMENAISPSFPIDNQNSEKQLSATHERQIPWTSWQRRIYHFDGCEWRGTWDQLMLCSRWHTHTQITECVRFDDEQIIQIMEYVCVREFDNVLGINWLSSSRLEKETYSHYTTNAWVPFSSIKKVAFVNPARYANWCLSIEMTMCIFFGFQTKSHIKTHK